MRLHDREYLLLGGTGGIGRALIEPLLAAGARVIVAARRPERVPHRPGLSSVQLDLAGDDLPDQLERLSSAYPGIDGVIHCAGQNRFAAYDTLPLAALAAQLDVNLRSAMLVARHFGPRFQRLGAGTLVFVGSTFGSIGYPGYTAYCASKFGLRGFTEALRRELADTPVQVIYVAPRATATAMNPEPVTALAREILRAMARGDRRRFLGWPEKLFVVVNGVLPCLVDRALLKQLPVIRRFLDSGVTS
jgi:NAD(P)-dependent dehydrogenase (short-subunit alcohol dehydrogenase family)